MDVVSNKHRSAKKRETRQIKVKHA